MAILAITSTAVFADNDGDDNNGTSAALIVSLEARTKLAPPVAPIVLPGPSGAAEVEVRTVDGVTNAEVELSTRGLAADTYTVAVTKKSGGSAVTLGTFIVAPVVTPAVVGKGASKDGDGKGKIEFSTKTGTLPAGFDGFDVASITVIDSKAVIVLGGDLTKSVDLVKRVRMIADASVPAAAGFVSISSSTRAGVTTPRFLLTARGLTPAVVVAGVNAAAATGLQLAINGADVQAVTPDARGRVTVRSLPASVDILGIKNVTIHDAANVNLLTAILEASEG